jgi:hypothetical protein
MLKDHNKSKFEDWWKKYAKEEGLTDPAILPVLKKVAHDAWMDGYLRWG